MMNLKFVPHVDIETDFIRCSKNRAMLRSGSLYARPATTSLISDIRYSVPCINLYSLPWDLSA